MEDPADKLPDHYPGNPPLPDPVEVGSDVRLAVAHLREQLTEAFNREHLTSGSPHDTNYRTVTLTPAAITVFRALSSAPGAPRGTGLRITKVEASAQDGVLRADLVAAPDANDRVIVEAGVRLFVEPDAEPHLGRKVLTAQVDESGQAQFKLREQHH